MLKLMNWLLLFVLCSCASKSMSRNMVKEGEFTLRGGVSSEKSWKDELIFKRTSWYQELTLVFELMVTEIRPTSQFYGWLSKRDREAVFGCHQVFVVLAYAQDPLKIDHTQLRNELELNKFSEVLLADFSNQVRLHPDFEQFSLRHYKVKGFCKKADAANEILINFPGFLRQKIY